MMRMLRDWGLAVVVGLSVFLLVDWLSKGADRRGDPAPAFALETPDGATVKLADYAGKTVVLNFWGSWCPPCVEEIPEFAAWSEKNPDVPILGIAHNSGSGKKLARDAEDLGITWTVLESSPAVIADYGVSIFPTTLVVGPDGVIKASAHGGIDADGLEALVASAR